MFDFERKRSSSTIEGIARTLHVCVGIAIIGFAGWALTSVRPDVGVFFAGIMLLGMLPIGIGLFGQRKTVMQTLFLGYWM